MFQKITEKEFYSRIKEQFPQCDIQILEFAGASKPIKYKCLKCGKEYNKTRANHMFENKTLCISCCSPKESTIKNKTMNLFKKKNNLRLLRYTNTGEHMMIQCLSCEKTFYRTPSNFLVSQKCPYCESKKPIITPEIFIEDYEEYSIVKKKTDKSFLCRHDTCGFIFGINITATMSWRNYRKRKDLCPKCGAKSSRGERLVASLLNELDISYEQEVNLSGDCARLRADFYLPPDIMIEYQGEQHYKAYPHFGGEKDFEKRLKNDERKRQWCKENNIKLIEIKYDLKPEEIKEILLSIKSSTTIPEGSSPKPGEMETSQAR